MSETLSIWLSMLALAVVQGLTEFLPVSSSGHLALGQILLGVGKDSLVEDVVLHAGTLVAVLVFYRRDLLGLGRGCLRADSAPLDAVSSRAYVGLILLGNLPAIFIGFTFRERIEDAFDRPGTVLVAMAATAVLLWTTRGMTTGDRPLDWRRALLIGCAQAVAILPGASRSGWTIATALRLGLRPDAAARYSFLLSIPAIGGALLLELVDHEDLTTPVGALVLGFAVSAIVGLFALRWLVALVRRMELWRFALYLAALVLLGGGYLLLR